jgi:DNA-binding CsgD family transcriptional regulator
MKKQSFNISPETEEMIRLTFIFSEILQIPYALFDHRKEDFIYFSKKFKEVTYSPLNAEDTMDLSHIESLIHPKDFELHKKVYAKITKQFNEIYSLNTSAKVFSRTVQRVRTSENSYTFMRIIMKPIQFSKEGKIELSLSFLNPSKSIGYDRYAIYSVETESQYYYSSIRNEFVKQKEDVNLNDIEIEILRLSSKGLKEPQISKLLNIKIDLFRYYKKNIFKKYHVSNIVEAVYIGSFYGII